MIKEADDIHDGNLYFGEATFYIRGGFIKCTPPEWNLELGECLRLPNMDIKKSREKFGESV